ncbi:MAG: DUF3108 domain-containing protein [Longimicrobiales bacterium]
MRRTLAIALFSLLMTTPGVRAQLGSALAQPVPFPVAKVPFGIGEQMTYRVDWGFLSVGQGRLEILPALDSMRGVPTYHIGFTMKGGLPLYRVDDYSQSWLTVSDLISLRFDQNLDEGSYERHRIVDFFPEEGRWDRLDHEEEGELPSADPLDDISFLYFVRTLPLEVGETYTFNRYWKDEGNPVTVKVLRKETVKVPAGEFETIVVRPIIKTRGMFSEGGEAEVYFTDDSRRLIVKLNARMNVGTLKMALQSYSPGIQLFSTAPPGNTP